MADRSDDAVPCLPNPDIAGVGIVISFATSAILTLVISLACGALKLIRPSADPTTLDLDLDRETSRRLKSKRLRCICPRPILLSKNRGVAVYMWHYILGELALGLGFNQTITGIGLLICTYAKYGIASEDPHVSLAHALSFLSVASQALVVPSLPLSRMRWVNLRLQLSVLYTYVFLVVTAIAFHGAYHIATIISDVTNATFCCGILLVCAAIGQFHNSEREEDVEKLMSSHTTSGRTGFSKTRLAFICSFALGTALVVYYLVVVFKLKYDQHRSKGCDLNIPAENEWTLGQIFALIMLVAFLLPVKEIYSNFFEQRALAEKQRRKQEHQSNRERHKLNCNQRYRHFFPNVSQPDLHEVDNGISPC